MQAGCGISGADDLLIRARAVVFYPYFQSAPVLLSYTRDSVTRIQAESSSSRWAQLNLNHNNSGLNSLESCLLAQCPGAGPGPHLTPAILICKCIDSVLALSQSESVQLALAQSESVAQSESAQGFAANPCASGGELESPGVLVLPFFYWNRHYRAASCDGTKPDITGKSLRL